MSMSTRSRSNPGVLMGRAEWISHTRRMLLVLEMGHEPRYREYVVFHGVFPESYYQTVDALGFDPLNEGR